jgi:hypothetical protein
LCGGYFVCPRSVFLLRLSPLGFPVPARFSPLGFQNASGDCFGDWKLEQVVRDNQSRPPAELSEQLLSEIRVWQSASVAQQDDITLIVIDVV